MKLDLARARADAEVAAERSGLTLDQRRDIRRRIRAADGATSLLTLEEEEAYYKSLVIYTGGLGSLGCGTFPEDGPKCRAMEAEYQRVFWGDAA